MPRKWWIDTALVFALYYALFATVGSQPLWKVIAIGLICSGMRQSYHWSKS